MVSGVRYLQESFNHYRKGYELYYQTNKINNNINEEKIIELNNIMLNLYGMMQKENTSENDILKIIDNIPILFNELFLEISKLDNNSKINKFETNLTNCYALIYDAAEELNYTNINNFNKSHI